jgi:hypothetical protein
LGDDHGLDLLRGRHGGEDCLFWEGGRWETSACFGSYKGRVTKRWAAARGHGQRRSVEYIYVYIQSA